MKGFFKSTYVQLTVMFGALLLINLGVFLLAFRYFTFAPAANQMAAGINSQMLVLKQVLSSDAESSQKQLQRFYPSQQVILEQNPVAEDIPGIQFYQQVKGQIDPSLVERVQLDVNEDPPRLWLKPSWTGDYWLGLAFYSYIGNLSYLVLGIGLAMFLLTLAAALFFSRYMLKPFKQLASMATDIVSGESMENPGPIKGSREVVHISQLVQSTALQIQKFNKEKETLLAGVSHDLRTPLTRMRLQLEFMSDDEMRDSLSSEIDELNSIIDEFIGYVKSGSEETFQDTDLLEILTDSIKSYNNSEPVIELETSLKSCKARIKPLSIKRMLTNVYDNALKYGEPPIVVQLQLNSNGIQIRIYDHGPGIAEDELDKIFDPFYMSQKQNNSFGSGLGLSIVKKLAQQNQARVTANNHPGAGLQIEILLQTTD